MDDAVALTRRTVLLSYPAYHAAQAIPSPQPAKTTGCEVLPLLSRLYIPPDLIIFGRFCLQTMQESQSQALDVLHDLLVARIEAAGGDIADLGNAIRASVVADYRSGNTRELAGWYLAETEILLGALAARAFA